MPRWFYPHLEVSWRLRKRASSRGFAYIMALFMIVALIITSQVAIQNIVTKGRREREDDMIWRGQQYVRAIRLFYRKTGKYPQNLEDLKKGLPELHFLRYAAYKDPMKKDDGAWRFIYVNAAGQIIGSTKYATLQQMAIMDMNGGKIPGVKKEGDSDQPGVPVSSLADQSNNSNSSSTANNANSSNSTTGVGTNTPSNQPPGASPDSSANANTPQNANSNPNANQQNPNSPGAAPNPTNAAGAPAGAGGINTNLNNLNMAALAALKPTGPVDGPVLGGFLTGVASSIDKPSVRIYNGGKKYINWEFIWNPVEDQAKAVQGGLNNPGGMLPGGQPGQSIGTGPAGTGGSSIFGNSNMQPNTSPTGPSSPANSPSPNPLQPSPQQ